MGTTHSTDTAPTGRPEHLAVAAAGRTAELIADPAVARGWGEDSVLPGYRVGGLAAHLARALETVRTYLAADAPAVDARLVDAVGYYRAVLGEHDPRSSDFHQAVRERGEARVAAGHDTLVTEVRGAADWFAAEELDLDRPVSVLAGTAMRLGDYLDTRLVEMLVHGRDLAASVALPIPAYDEEAWRTVAQVLTRATAARHGWRGLALGLARPELGVGAFTVGPA
ncbi:maleylpyruvate isomerase N-terminal domain-containing protein [Nocardioides sp. zg-DK7169]|uniref:maleylpyruvate isomerase N-terminal domain-containing protein n=1 Tax=Nocardioides sp. zg-DK7169 TaxID=2736600 RepID=UPI001551AF55|nr:maleylpyruvate isomerase N-terminal domain-containing protein [Nocardioides sp. zg-DK7169]NPC96576.1 hypothetical protein [Nocardioides sp. zg-DK7169]